MKELPPLKKLELPPKSAGDPCGSLPLLSASPGLACPENHRAGRAALETPSSWGSSCSAWTVVDHWGVGFRFEGWVWGLGLRDF